MRFVSIRFVAFGHGEGDGGYEASSSLAEAGPLLDGPAASPRLSLAFFATPSPLQSGHELRPSMSHCDKN
jgi:hypothetical protein